MKLTPTLIPDVVLLEPHVFTDERGWFMESFNENSFQAGLNQLGLPAAGVFVQDNHSVSKKNVLRGLHFQLPPFAQGKLVRVTQGAAFDVAVDLREGSPTFGNWVGVRLSGENKSMLWIPPGFAHGFLALEDDTHFLYKTTGFYHPPSERSLRWNDAQLSIQWPLQSEPMLHHKDANAPLLSELLTTMELSCAW